jgi:hypothetical protein
MTNQPITPPNELVARWSVSSPIQPSDESWAYELFIAHQAARWGSDQELEACCLLLDNGEHAASYGCHNGTSLRAARRPKPPSLKEQALAILDDCSDRLDGAHENTIRRALEQLND